MTVLVIHAKHLTERLQHINQQLKDWPGEIAYILDLDKDELTPEILAQYIKPGSELDKIMGHTSCAIKHFLASQYIIDHQLEGALILEDDIVLHPHFVRDFQKTMEEYQRNYSDRPVIISYEDSSLQFIPRSQRVNGQWLYKAPKGRVRFTGALYVNQKAAQVIINDVKTNKCDRAIDHYQMKLYGSQIDAISNAEALGGQVKNVRYLELLSDKFTRQEFENLRAANHQPTNVRMIISRWCSEGLVKKIDTNLWQKC